MDMHGFTLVYTYTYTDTDTDADADADTYMYTHIYIYTSLTPFPNPVMAIYVHALCVAICDSSCNAIIEDANDTRLQVQATQC